MKTYYVAKSISELLEKAVSKLTDQQVDDILAYKKAHNTLGIRAVLESAGLSSVEKQWFLFELGV